VVDICLVKPDERLPKLESELDEMWSLVGKKANQRWLWQAIERQSGKVLAYVFGERQDEVFLQLKEMLMPFGISHFYTDDWGAYKRHPWNSGQRYTGIRFRCTADLEAPNHEVGKKNTQKIENKHPYLRTRIKRLARKTICFSKTIYMHDLVIGLFINRYEFGELI
jgi:insertion element IS1 protein InsB